jgi:ribonuclease P protein component
MGKFTFRKEEKLTKEKDIQELFAKGSSFYLFPFKILTSVDQNQQKPFHKVLISVSKRNFKRAVDRNMVKRRVREAYRLNKNVLPVAPFLHIGFIYTHKEILPTEEISSKMVHALKRISKLSVGTSKSS